MKEKDFTTIPRKSTAGQAVTKGQQGKKNGWFSSCGLVGINRLLIICYNREGVFYKVYENFLPVWMDDNSSRVLSRRGGYFWNHSCICCGRPASRPRPLCSHHRANHYL